MPLIRSKSKQQQTRQWSLKRIRQVLTVILILVVLVCIFYSYQVLQFHTNNSSSGGGGVVGHSLKYPLIQQKQQKQPIQQAKQRVKQHVDVNNKLPPAFRRVLERAKENQLYCSQLEQPDQQALPTSHHQHNVTLVDLPDFGIIKALQDYETTTLNSPNAAWPECTLPPETECSEVQFTAVFLGYRPDRLVKLKREVHKMLWHKDWKSMVHSVVLVWNGNTSLAESIEGQALLGWQADVAVQFHIYFPSQQGFSNDLMNRYHPNLNITTKAILYYDDDGPFYRHTAILSGFELWKRNSNAQIGAMARVLDLSDNQLLQKRQLISVEPQTDERQFIAHCRAQAGHKARYNFQFFANFGANMVLPSGSFLHSNYLCFLWHPALWEIRQFVRDHPVHPDDITVSTIVSHLAGRAPKVYSRRINARQQDDNTKHRRRRLLWDDGDTGVWAKKRESAVNSLLSYFGSINSGSNGWCYKTPYHDTAKNVCEPWMAREGMIPWLQENMEPLKCPDERKVTTFTTA